MKLLLSFLLLGSLCFAETAEPFRTDTVPDVPQNAFKFEYAPHRGPIPYSLGLIKKANVRGFVSAPPSKEFLSKDIVIPDRFELSQLTELAPIKNQGNCGSCVSFAVSAVVEDIYRIRGQKLPTLSNQYQMSCGKRQWICDGSFFEKTADDYLILNGTASAEKYPYTASNASCKGKTTELYGAITSFKLIDNSEESIEKALVSGYPVAVTVGADNYWSGYRGGEYNACTNAGTNHQVVLVGFDKVKKLWKVRNSWGTSWGEAGYMWSKMKSSSGRLCNNLAEEAGIVEIALQPSPTPTITPTPTPGPTPEPTKWDWKSIGVIVAIALGLAAFIIALVKK